MEFSKLVGTRYSCKQYSERVPDEATIQSILEMARLADSKKSSGAAYLCGQIGQVA